MNFEEDAGDYADRMCATHGHPCVPDELRCWCGDNTWPDPLAAVVSSPPAGLPGDRT